MKGEAECVANQPTRWKIGEGLKYHGLFMREWHGYVQTGAFGKLDALSLWQKGKVAQIEASGEAFETVKKEG